MIGETVIVVTCRDGSKRVILWDVAGDGPGNTWTRLSAIVDRNIALGAGPPWQAIEMQAALVEPIDRATVPR